MPAWRPKKGMIYYEFQDVFRTLMIKRSGLDRRQLDMPGRQRLDVDYGTPIYEIMV